MQSKIELSQRQHQTRSVSSGVNQQLHHLPQHAATAFGAPSWCEANAWLRAKRGFGEEDSSSSSRTFKWLQAGLMLGSTQQARTTSGALKLEPGPFCWNQWGVPAGTLIFY